MKIVLKNIVLVILSFVFLSACGAREIENNDGVQDIQPGEKSIISAPATSEKTDSIEERPI